METAAALSCWLCCFEDLHWLDVILAGDIAISDVVGSSVATQNVVTLQNVVITTFCLALAWASIGKM